MKRASVARDTRGLSLLEVMVTVAIFAMLFAVLMAGWHQSMKAQTQLASASDAVQRRQHISLLLRHVVSESLNPQLSSGSKFQGNASGFSTESTTSLEPRIGSAPLAVELRIQEEGSGRQLEVLHDGQLSGRFDWNFASFNIRYVDAAGQIHESWPLQPRMDQVVSAMENAAHLPALVVINYALPGEPGLQQLLVNPRNTAWELAEPSAPMAGIGLQ